MDPKLLASSAALNEGRKPEAADLIISYLADNGGAARNVYSVLLALLAELRRIDDGLLWSRRALDAAPRDAEFLNMRGAFLRMAGRSAEAITIFDQAIRLRPADIAAQINKGYCYNDLGNGKAAEPIFTKLIRQKPRDSRLHRALARALSLQGKIGAAEARLRQLLALDNRNVDAWLDLSATAFDRSDYQAALKVFDRALKALPDDQRLLEANAVMLRTAGELDAARSFLIDLSPRYPNQAWIPHELATIFADQDPSQELAFRRRACELAPHNIKYRLDLVLRLLVHKGEPVGTNLDDARAVLAEIPRTVSLDAYEARIRHSAYILTADCEADEGLGEFSYLTGLLASARNNDAFLNFLGQVKTPADRRLLVELHRQVGDHLIAQAKLNPVKIAAKPASQTRIRIGFMSSDLRSHPVTYFAWPLFEYADRERFEIFCYSWYRGAEPDTAQQRLMAMVDGFRWRPAISDRDAAQLIADDGLDILIEMGGMTHMNKLNVMAWKPARICASWLGYPHSAGLDTIDYLLVDPFLKPTSPELLIEKPLVLPSTWLTMSKRAFPENLAINPVAPVIRNGFITFGTANNPYKFNGPMLRTWALVMAGVQDSRFVFVRPEAGSQTFQHNIRAAFAAEGIAEGRIEFRAIRGHHMPCYNDIDVALDTFPQTGGTTTCESLWMGVPTVTLIGKTMYERMSYSFLSNAGLGDLCATSEEEFVDIAVRLAGAPDRIQQLRTTLRDQVLASPLGQTQQFAKDFYDVIASVAG